MHKQVTNHNATTTTNYNIYLQFVLLCICIYHIFPYQKLPRRVEILPRRRLDAECLRLEGLASKLSDRLTRGVGVEVEVVFLFYEPNQKWKFERMRFP